MGGVCMARATRSSARSRAPRFSWHRASCHAVHDAPADVVHQAVGVPLRVHLAWPRAWPLLLLAHVGLVTIPNQCSARPS